MSAEVPQEIELSLPGCAFFFSFIVCMLCKPENCSFTETWIQMSRQTKETLKSYISFSPLVFFSIRLLNKVSKNY